MTPTRSGKKELAMYTLMLVCIRLLKGRDVVVSVGVEFLNVFNSFLYFLQNGFRLIHSEDDGLCFQSVRTNPNQLIINRVELSSPHINGNKSITVSKPTARRLFSSSFTNLSSLYGPDVVYCKSAESRRAQTSDGSSQPQPSLLSSACVWAQSCQ